MRVDGASPRRFLRFLSLTALQAEGCGGALRAQIIKEGGAAGAAGCVEGLWKKVLKMDRPLAGGFLSLTAFQAEGCGIALTGDEYEVSVTGLAVCVICDTISSATYFLVSP